MRKNIDRVLISFILLGPVLSQVNWFLSYAPFTEGWWHVYARSIGQGKLPYRDFELLSTPLYPYFIHTFSQVFGEEFYKFRILGLLISALLSLILYLILKNYTNIYNSALISAISIIFLQNSNAFINYDYNYIAILFILVSLFIITQNQCKLNNYLLSGISIGLSFLFKQSFAISVLSILIITLIAYKKIKYLLTLNVGFLIPNLIIYIYFFSSNGARQYLTSIWGAASESKGGYEKILFAWIPRFFVSLESFMNLIYISTFILIFFYLIKNFQKFNRITSLLAFFYFIIKIRNNSINIYQNFLYIVHFLPIILVCINYLKSIWVSKFDKKIVLYIYTIGIFLGSMLSAGVSELGSFLALTVFLLLIAKYLNDKTKSFTFLTIIIISLIISINIEKINKPYYWWNYSIAKIDNNQVIIESGLQKNLKISKDDLSIRNSILAMLPNQIDCKNFIQFPHMPFFQLEKGCKNFNYFNLFWPDFTSIRSYSFVINNKNNFEYILINLNNESAFSLQADWFNKENFNYIGKIQNTLTDLRYTSNYKKMKFEFKNHETKFLLFVK